MSEWRLIETDPLDGSFRFYGLHCKNGKGFKWFEAYYVAYDYETDRMVTPSGDDFSDWSYDDFEVWCEAPKPPAAFMDDKREGK